MKAKLTITLSAESKDEVMSTFPSEYKFIRESFEKVLKDHGFMGVVKPEHTVVRWLLDSSYGNEGLHGEG
jgi:hypothetical protein